MEIKVTNFKSVKKGFVEAKFDVEISSISLTIRDYTLFSKGNERWIQCPCRMYEIEGKKKYFSFIDMKGDVKQKFDKECMSQIEKCYLPSF